MSKLRLVVLLFATSVVGSRCFAQASPPYPSSVPRKQPAETSSGDIVVEGYRLRADVETKVSAPSGVSPITSRQTYEYSERLAGCAARSKLSSLAGLRAVVDGEFHTAVHAAAQDGLKRTYITCGSSPNLLTVSSPEGSGQGATDQDGTSSATNPFHDPTPLGYSIYDRGAFTIAALKRFAPDLVLTTQQTTDPAVQSRFNLREGPRNRFRLSEDYQYFAVAVCMVQVEPRLSVRLAMSDAPARLGDLQAALIDRARVCVGGAKRVQVDPTQFRLYIGDAVYRWAVAAKGVDSLIPGN